MSLDRDRRIGRAKRFGSDPPELPPGVHLERWPALADLVPADVSGQLRDLPGLILLESARGGRSARWSYLAADPLAVLEVPSPGPDPFREARVLLRRLAPGVVGPVPFAGGLAGFLGYDLGRRFERLPEVAIDDQWLPVIRLALHDWTIAWDHLRGEAYLAGRSVDGDEGRLADRLAQVRQRLVAVGGGGAAAAREPAASPRDPLGQPHERLLDGRLAHRPAAPLRFVSNLDVDAYRAAIERLRGEIAAGSLYQANLARRLAAQFEGDPWPIYRHLRAGDAARFGAYIALGRGEPGTGLRAIVSASPEPFLAVSSSGLVSSDPIKGTRARGLDADEERDLARDLLTSAKDRAENLMIVDVLRNDLGRVCVPGSVRVPRLARLERAGSVQHLVSTISGQLAGGRDAFDLLAAAFPGGSVTGAPKVRAMELIELLEPVRRGPYTGAAVWIGPDGAMQASLLIRTFVADGRRLTLHVGGGITWRSDPGAEWEETRAKAHGPLSAIGGSEVSSIGLRAGHRDGAVSDGRADERTTGPGRSMAPPELAP